ncbi:TonB-dependent receptor [Aequoribacter fuscus]|uniref:TonB-dependent receptor n=1 Tax=Aequoribacter fuscus TaxID=2518989 RepID=F3KYW5_9GAMM|nr:TonB-dependent receptor [Aequoribacter fuscus]EGG30729.1 TonB-dependent receptor [Aequoribacter fuscus]QHJ88487.1 TonB-dependent receptor [Aequoribacter fuscus]
MLFNTKRRILPVAIGLATGIATISAPSFSQENENATSEGVLEEIVVYGIKNSLLDAISIKRDAVGVMDAISAEDFGKFPDGNLAESLARAPGIAIDRSNVEGQKIAVRGFGPEFNLVTLNGRQMPTVKGQYGGGRSFNFGDIASPGVASLEIFKTANSSLPSGGIGSTVNMVTTKPLNVEGTKRFLGLSYVNDTTSQDSGSPFEAEMLFATNQGRWGFSLSGAYHERTNRETGTRESNWITPNLMAQSEGYLRVDASNPNYTNLNERVDGNTFYREPAAFLIKDNDRTRKNLQATLQVELSDSVTATVDYTHSGVQFESRGMLFGSWLGGWDTQSATINQNGVFTDVVVGNRAYDHTATWSKLESDNNSVGVNLAWDVTDALSISLDYHSSTAELAGNIFDNELGFTTDVKGTITVDGASASGVNSFSYDRDFLPENYMGTYLFLRDGYQENEIEQVQLKGLWTNDSGSVLQSISFGVSSIDNEYLNQASEGNFGSQGPSVEDYDDALFKERRLTNSFMNSFSRNIGTPYYYSINPVDALSAFAAANVGLADPVDGTVCCSYGTLDSNEQVKEQLDSAFVQFNFETSVNDMPLRVVAGLRYEKSDTTSVSFYPAPTTIRWDMIAGLIGVGGESADVPRYGDSSEVLPTIAAALNITENQVIRASWGKSIARPNLGDLGAELNIGSKDFFNLTAQGGNPDLGPLLSTNFDISYENYYAEGSYFAVAAFRKEVKDFIGSRTIEDQPIDGLTNPFLSEIGQQAQACVQAWVDAGRPQTGFPGEGGTGDCVSQQALWAQPWMNDQQHMGWVALAISRGIDVSNGFPWGACDYDGWWRCEPGYIDGTAADPQALFDITQPYNMESGAVNGIEVSWQHLFEGTPYGFQFNFTKVSGGNVEPNKNVVGEQFVLPGLGDSGNISVFMETQKHTLRLALNYRGETAQGFANYFQPVYVDERKQFDISYQYRFSDALTIFADAMNITDEETRLYVRYPEMLFLSQDHGPVFKFGVRSNF